MTVRWPVLRFEQFQDRTTADRTTNELPFPRCSTAHLNPPPKSERRLCSISASTVAICSHWRTRATATGSRVRPVRSCFTSRRSWAHAGTQSWSRSTRSSLTPRCGRTSIRPTRNARNVSCACGLRLELFEVRSFGSIGALWIKVFDVPNLISTTKFGSHQLDE